MTGRDTATGQSLVQSIASDSLGELLGDLGEVAIDCALSEGVLRDIPIIGSITGLFRAGREIRSELFLKKIAIFLSQISEASHGERQQFAKRFANDAESRRFGESVLLLLERAENMEKPRIVGRIMRAAIRGQIDLTKAMRLAAIVDRCYMQDLDHLPMFESGPQLDEFRIVVEALQSVGLLSTAGFDGGNMDEDPIRSGTVYVLNEYGELLIRYGLQADA